MNRRSFFSSLFGSCGAAGTCAVAQSTAPSKYRNVAALTREMNKNGERIKETVRGALNSNPIPLSPDYHDRQGLVWARRWSGWKSRDSSDHLFGQWIAYAIHASGELNHQRFHVYSATPGAVAYFTWGDMFDLALHDGQEFIDHLSTEHSKQVEKQLALIRLMNFLDSQPVIPEYRRFALASL